MSELAQAEARLQRFLDGAGLSVEAVQEHISKGFGPPLLAVATGSIIAGYGNARSDLDVHVILSSRPLSHLPIMGYLGGCRVDADLHAADALSGSMDELRSGPWPARRTLRADWRRYRTALHDASRLAVGVAIQGEPRWREWCDGFRDGWVRELASNWSRVEALRRQLAARWLFDEKPRLACLRYCEAVLHGVEAEAARRGEVFLGSKWAPQKAHRLDDEGLIRAVRAAQALPFTTAECRKYRTRCEDLVEELVRGSPFDGERLVAQLHYSSDVEVRRLGASSLVTRWDLHGLSVPTSEAPGRGAEDDRLWEGPLDSALPAPLLELFRHNLVWLGLASAEQPEGKDGAWRS